MLPARLAALEPHRPPKAQLAILDHEHLRHMLRSPQQQASMPGLCTRLMPSWNPVWSGSTILRSLAETRGKLYCRRSVSSPLSVPTHSGRRLNHSGLSASQVSSDSLSARANGVRPATKRLLWRRTNSSILSFVRALRLSCICCIVLHHHSNTPSCFVFTIGYYTPGDWLFGSAWLRPDRRSIHILEAFSSSLRTISVIVYSSCQNRPGKVAFSKTLVSPPHLDITSVAL